MAWLIGWNRRKPKLVKGSTAGIQTDYQLKLTVYKGSGTDTVNTIYLGGYVNDDFSDLRFTSSDETTLLPYWIESYISGVSAIVWIKIDSIPADPFSKTVYLYYDNPVAVSASNGTNTFIAFDDFATGSSEQWTMGAGVTADRVTNHRLNINGSSGVNVYAYLTKASDIGDYEFLYHYRRTSTGGSEGFGVATGDSFVSDFNNINDGICWIDHKGGIALYKYLKLNDQHIQTQSQLIFGADNTEYWGKLTRLNDVHTNIIYSNSLRTTVVGTQALTRTGITNQKFIYAVASVTELATTGWMTDIILRKLASPEPIWDQSSPEQIYTANLTVSSTPAGAEIWINNIDQGVTTTGWFILNPGTYTIMLTKPGYEDYIEIITLESNQNAIVQGNLISAVNITATNMIVTRSEIPCRVGICTVTVDVTWTNNGGSSGDFIPNITIDGTPYSSPYPLQSLGSGASVTKTFIISGLTIGTRNICPMPN